MIKFYNKYNYVKIYGKAIIILNKKRFTYYYNIQ